MFLLFKGNRYYPDGGGNDLVGRHETMDNAKNQITKPSCEDEDFWANIIDTDDIENITRFYDGKWHVAKKNIEL